MVIPKKGNDCEDGTCKEIYGAKKRELWCKQCDEKRKTISSNKKKESTIMRSRL